MMTSRPAQRTRFAVPSVAASPRAPGRGRRQTGLLPALACAVLPLAAGAAPQVQTPGFYLETLGNPVEEVQKDPFTPERYFRGIFKGTSMAFAREVDTVFVAEKDGRVRVIVDGEMQLRPVVDMKDQVATYIDRGIGGIDVHPDFPAVKEIVIAWTHENGITDEEGPKYAKVARLALREEINADGEVELVADAPTDADVILGKLSATAEFPSCNDRPLGADCGAVDFGSHSFTFVRYGPDDGLLYIGTGDGAGFYSPDTNAFYAQRPEHLSGKILRVNPDGTGVRDNPFFTGDPEDNASKVFALGLRNPKSGSFDPDTGEFCVGNVGWYLNEGIYCLEAGDNAGWPCRENGGVLNGYQTLSLRRDGERLAGCPLEPGSWVEPDYAYPHQPSIIGGEELFLGAVIGCAIAEAAEYPDDFNGSCVFGDYVFDTISSVRLREGGGNPSIVTQVTGVGQPTDVATDRNGRVCFLGYETGIADGIPVSELRCLRHDDSGTVQRYPVVSFGTEPSATDPLGIDFNASTSYHTGGAPLRFAWDFGDGRGDTGVTASHVYDEPGDYTVTLTARASGERLTRATSQVVRLADPDAVTPVLPAVEGVEFETDEHFVSNAVPFGVRIRNDRGEEPFRALVNVYDESGTEIAHLVEEELVQIDEGETKTVPFVWPGTAGPGEYRMNVEFYAEDWAAWTLKYPSVATVLVRNRVSASIDQNETPDAPPVTGTPMVPEPAGPEDGTPADESPVNDGPVVATGGDGRSNGFLGAAGPLGTVTLLLAALFGRRGVGGTVRVDTTRRAGTAGARRRFLLLRY